MSKENKRKFQKHIGDVLTGEMQYRYAERPKRFMPGAVQIHPNYVSSPHFTVFGTPLETRRAVQSAFLLRWAGLNGKPIIALNEKDVVPNLVNMDGEEVYYHSLAPKSSFGLLETMGIVSIEEGLVSPSASVRRTMLTHPRQRFTVLPESVVGSIRQGKKALNIYNMHDFSRPDLPEGKANGALPTPEPSLHLVDPNE